MKIDAVIVTYNANLELLTECLNSLRKQVSTIWLIDNASVDFLEKNGQIGATHVIKLNENKGIAFAQNLGINNAIEGNADYVLLSDQDTIYPDNYVSKMILALEKEGSAESAAIVPLYHDCVGSKKNEGFFVNSKLGHTRIYPNLGQHRVSQAISSGMIINLALLSRIGKMNEELFIDWIDYEWCWRAINEGYQIIGNADVVIEHHLGESVIDLNFRSVNLRSPVRHYYITRNAFYLAIRCKYIDVLQKFRLFLKSITYFIGYPILSKPHLLNFRMTSLGMYHGLKGQLGRLDKSIRYKK